MPLRLSPFGTAILLFSNIIKARSLKEFSSRSSRFYNKPGTFHEKNFLRFSAIFSCISIYEYDNHFVPVGFSYQDEHRLGITVKLQGLRG